MILYTFLAKPIQGQKTHHYQGSLTSFELLPAPEVLIIFQDLNETQGFFLDRYTLDGSSCGDTWHQSLDDAKGQAAYEYGSSLQGWREIPEGVKDPIHYAIEQLKKN